MKHQQTIEMAIDLQTNRRIVAGELLTMSEVEFSGLRRTVMTNRVERERTGAAPMLVCGICRKPLYLSRFIRDEGNRWFEHDGASPDCPWYGRNRLSPELRRALIYRGQQEGERHRTIKNFVADFLEKEVGATSVNRELVTHGQILKGEWKRPDVQCVWQNKRIVFEIQLSYTFLSDVIKRDEFYRKEGIYIIWLFDVLDLRRATVRDEAFFNRRNLFILDESGMDESRRSGRLTFNGTFQAPVLMESDIADEWQSRFVTLDDIQFPTLSYPDAQTDNMRYDRPAFLESGMSDAPLNLPATAEEMRGQIRRTRSDSPVKEQAVTSAAKAGLPFVDFVASRHFRIPVDPAYWQRILTEATPDISSPLVPAP